MKCINAKIYSVLTATVLAATPLFSQDKSDVFKARFAATRNVAINVSVSKSDTIDLSQYLNTRAPIYSLSVDATIEQPREASFTRIVLEDTDGRDHLVLECDRFRYDQDVVHLSEFCQETALLFGIIPSRLKCYVAGDAQLSLNAIYATDQRPQRGLEQSVEKQSEQFNNLKRAQVQDVVDRINSYNIIHRKLWRANVTEESLNVPSTYWASDCDAYTENIRYYNSGIYEMGEMSEELVQVKTQSQVVDFFSWTKRHNYNWMTIIKNQGHSQYCTAFAGVAMLEALTRLYFNKRINIDLSEQDVAYYTPVDYYYGGYSYQVAQYLRNTGTHNESLTPFQDTDTPNMPNPRSPSSTWITDYFSHFGNSVSEDSLKRELIKYGPGSAGTSSHEMALTGFGVIQAGDSFTNVSSSNVISIVYNLPDTDPRQGMTYWEYKNSNSQQDGNGGYRHILYHNYWYMGNVIHALTPIISTTWSDSDIVIEDRDGDGYYNWGIGERPASCPAWVPIEKDGDDSDYTKGPMDINGNISTIVIPTNTIYINTSTTLVNMYYHNHVTVQNNANLTITGNVTCYRGVTMTINSGSTLIIDGGTLKDVNLQLQSGASLIIQNGGKLKCNPAFPFTLPVGATLNQYNGTIR